jgi:hypothetical protein
MQLIPFNELVQMAEVIAESKLFGIQNAKQALALGLLCQAEGRHIGEAGRDYHIISGKPVLKSEIMLARFQAAGGKVEWNEYKDDLVSATFTHPQAGSLKVTWTLQDAKRAGLLGNQTWQKYPKQMLSNRVISEGIRRTYPGVLSGCYTPEEITDMNLPVIVESVQPIQLEAPKVMQIEAPKETAVEPVKEPEPLPEQISAINLMDRLLAEKTKAQKDKVTAGAIKKGWIKEGQTFRDIPVSIQSQAVAFPEKFFAAFGI